MLDSILARVFGAKNKRELTPTRSGGDERGPLGALGGIFSSED